MTAERQRPLLPELMDDPALPLDETERALLDLERVNRWLLGIGASRRTLLPLLGGETNRCSLLDVGTGSGQIAAALADSAARRGVSIQVIGVDRKLSHLLSGRRRSFSQLRVVAAAEALPFREAAVDWTHSNLLLHHFTQPENLAILHEMRRVSRHGVAVVDLRQSLWARLLFRLASPLLGLGQVASHDGCISTNQAWSLGEVIELTDGFDLIELRRRFPFRYSVVLGAAPRK